MALEAAPLHLVHLVFDVPAVLRSLPRPSAHLAELDTGYLLHGRLLALFGELAPKPFVLARDEGRSWEVYGYAAVPAAALAEQAQRFAEPAVHGSVVWPRLVSKPMPATWPAGLRAGFTLTACPVVRRPDRADCNAGAEVDVFLARAWQVGPEVPLAREEVYLDWLEGELARFGAARLDRTRSGLESFRRVQVYRRTQATAEAPERRLTRRERPEVRFRGTLEVTDPAGFAALLARGIGRHRGFGFGCLLLTPPAG